MLHDDAWLLESGRLLGRSRRRRRHDRIAAHQLRNHHLLLLLLLLLLLRNYASLWRDLCLPARLR